MFSVVLKSGQLSFTLSSAYVFNILSPDIVHHKCFIWCTRCKCMQRISRVPVMTTLKEKLLKPMKMTSPEAGKLRRNYSLLLSQLHLFLEAKAIKTPKWWWAQFTHLLMSNWVCTACPQHFWNVQIMKWSSVRGVSLAWCPRSTLLWSLISKNVYCLSLLFSATHAFINCNKNVIMNFFLNIGWPQCVSQAAQ